MLLWIILLIVLVFLFSNTKEEFKRHRAQCNDKCDSDYDCISLGDNNCGLCLNHTCQDPGNFKCEDRHYDSGPCAVNPRGGCNDRCDYDSDCKTDTCPRCMHHKCWGPPRG
jgi:hypothetical protein